MIGSGTALTTVFGSMGSDVTFANSSTPGAIMVAESGNETLTAAFSQSNNTLVGGTGADSLVGGSGNDVFWAGPGGDTMTGGAGANAFNFANGSSGGTYLIADFTSSDVVNLINYGANAAANALAAATTVNGSLTISLADNTKITFLDVPSVSAGNIHST